MIKTKSNEIVLVVVAHPDDEVLGMGGTIAYHINKEDKVYGMYMTDGTSARKNISKNSKLSKVNRINAAKKAANILGFTWLDAGNFPDNEMDKEPLLKYIRLVEKVKKKINPTIVYTHSIADLNIDHRITNQAILTAFRPQPNESCKEINSFEIPSATDYGHNVVAERFVPNKYVDITDFIKQKIKALNCYNDEMKDYPHPRSYAGIEILAKYRGMGIGVNYAEAFQILRSIVKK